MRHLARALAALLVVLIGWELVAALPSLLKGQIQDHGIRLVPTVGLAVIDGSSIHGRVAAIQPGAALPPACAVRVGGELIVADAPVVDRWLVPKAGTQIFLQAAPAHTAGACGSIAATSRPLSSVELFDYVGRALTAIAGLIFMGIVARKSHQGPHRRNAHYRYLALAFATISTNLFLNFSFLGGTVGHAAKWLAMLASPCVFAWLATFALRYHPARHSWIHRHVRELTALTWLLTGATSLCTALYLAGHPVPALNQLYSTSVTVSVIIGFLALNVARQHAVGQHRQRILWLQAAFVIGLGPALILAGAAASQAGPALVEKLVILMLLLGMLSWTVLGYAVLRHQVFDMQLAVSRLAVWACISVLLLGVVAGVKYGAESAAHEVWPEVKPLFWMVAVLIYFGFHWLHGHIEEAVKRVLFRPWKTKADALQRFVQMSAHYTSRHDLLESFHHALDAFNDGMGSALYLQLEGGEFAQAFNSVPGAPRLIGENDALIVQLKDTPRPRALRQEDGEARARPQSVLSDSRSAMAFPMPYRGGISGLVVMASKRHGQDYRPDEVELLERATHKVAFHLQSLRLERAMQRA